MSFGTLSLVTARCDGCGSGWWHNCADERPVFTSQAAAKEQLEDDYGWLFDRDIVNGKRSMLCSVCRTRTVCQLKGCEPTHPLLLDGRLPTCVRCCRIVRDEQPATAHPDRLAGDIPDALADLEAALHMEAAVR